MIFISSMGGKPLINGKWQFLLYEDGVLTEKCFTVLIRDQFFLHQHFITVQSYIAYSPTNTHKTYLITQPYHINYAITTICFRIERLLNLDVRNIVLSPLPQPCTPLKQELLLTSDSSTTGASRVLRWDTPLSALYVNRFTYSNQFNSTLVQIFTHIYVSRLSIITSYELNFSSLSTNDKSYL